MTARARALRTTAELLLHLFLLRLRETVEPTQTTDFEIDRFYLTTQGPYRKVKPEW